MTLQNGLVHGSTAYLWCDTAYFDFNGNLLGQASKAMSGQIFPWAGIWSCIGGQPNDLAQSIGSAMPITMQGLLIATSAALRDYARQGHTARVLIAAWEDRPQLWLVSTDEAAGEPFVPCEAVHYLNTGNALPEYRDAAATGLTPVSMVSVIDAQLAAQPVAGAGLFGENGQCVRYGGNIIEIEVGATGVESRVVRAVAA